MRRARLVVRKKPPESAAQAPKQALPKARAADTRTTT
jgi:hypothetical protein